MGNEVLVLGIDPACTFMGPHGFVHYFRRRRYLSGVVPLYGSQQVPQMGG